MVSSKEHLTIERMVRIIHDAKKIKYFELIDRARISISKYNQLKTYMLDRYDNQIQYDKALKTYTSLIAIGQELEDNKRPSILYPEKK